MTNDRTANYREMLEGWLKANPNGQVDEFMRQYQLSNLPSLIEELSRLRTDILGRTARISDGGTVAATVYHDSLPTSGKKAKTVIQTVTNDKTAVFQESGTKLEDVLDRTWAPVLTQRDIQHTTSLKSEVNDDSVVQGDSATNLIIQPRSLKTDRNESIPVADYEMLKTLGEGGMGVVFAARQGSLDRTVAVKMLKSKASANANARNDFLSEACVTGDLEHPNIVPIYDLGRNSNGDLFYAMKRVQGTPWSERIGSMSLSENIETLLRVSDAVAFAHSRGIVHRDLKPENVMLGEYGEVLVMDWGLAILVGSERRLGGISKARTMGGTPAYMPPEMAAGPFEAIGPASDVYLLGAILYEIVTGNRPHNGNGVSQCLVRAAKNVIEPTNKSGELVDIARIAMATDPRDRYQSVRAFQEAIRGYLSHSESISLSTLAAEQFERAKRTDEYEDFNRALFGFQQAIELWDGNLPAKAGLAAVRLAFAQHAQQNGDYELGIGLLDGSVPEHRTLHAEISAAKLDRDMRQRRLKRYKRIGLAMGSLFASVVTMLAIWLYFARAEAAENARVATSEKHRANRERDEAHLQRVRAERGEAEANTQKHRAEENLDLAKRNEEEAVQARKAEAYEAYVARIGASAAKIEENAFDGARQLLKACVPTEPSEVDHRHFEWGRLKFLAEQASMTFVEGERLECLAVVESSDGELQKIFSGGQSGKVVAWDPGGNRVSEIDVRPDAVQALATSPDHRLIAVATSSKLGTVRVCQIETGKTILAIAAETDNRVSRRVLSVDFSNDGKRLLTGSEDGTARIYDVLTGRQLAVLHGHRWWVWRALFWREKDIQTETRIVTAGHDGLVNVWTDESGEWNNPQQIKLSPPFRGHAGPVFALACSMDGQTIASAGQDERILLWNPAELQEFDFSQAAVTAGARSGRQSLLDAGSSLKGSNPARVLSGHVSPIRDLSFSGDGRTLVSCGHDNTVRYWNIVSEELVKTLRGHGEWVRACSLVANNTAIVSASYDGSLRLWDIRGYQDARVLGGNVLAGHGDAVLDASFASSGHTVVTASRDRTVRTWNAASGQEVKTLREGHSFLVSRAAFSQDGETLVTSAVDGTARIWNVANGSQRHVLTDSGRTAAVSISSDGRYVLTGGPVVSNDPVVSDDKQQSVGIAKLWGARNGRLIYELQGHSAQITTTAISNNAAYLFTGDFNGRGVIWDRETGRQLHRLSWHGAKIIGAKFIDGDAQLLTASIERSVGTWDVRTGQRVPNKTLLHPHDLVSMDTDSSGRRVITCGDDNGLRIWDSQSGSLIREVSSKQPPVPGQQIRPSLSPDANLFVTVDPSARCVRLFRVDDGNEVTFPTPNGEEGPLLQLPEQAQLWGAIFTPDGKRIVTLGGDQVQLWDLTKDQQQYRRLRSSFSPHGVVSTARYSSDGNRIVSGSWDGTAIIWDAQKGTTIAKLTGAHSGRVNWASFSPDPKSNFVLTASDDGSAVLWNSSGEFVRRFGGTRIGQVGPDDSHPAGHAGPVLSGAFSPAGDRVLTASQDGSVLIWNVRDGVKPIVALRGHRGPIECAVFSYDGRRIVTGSADNSARVWNAENGQLELTLNGHTAPVNSVAFSADGRRILTGSADATAKIWDAEYARKTDSGTGESELLGKELLTLSGHSREVTSVAFAPDGLSVLTASEDGTAIIWQARRWD